MPDARVTLRDACIDDLDRTLAWANDPDTRAASFRPGTITREEHAAWLTRCLDDRERHFFIAESDGTPVGLLRLEPGEAEPGTPSAVISINVAPAARGRGVGTAMLVAAVQRGRALGHERIVAFIRQDNDASVRAFERAGFAREGAASIEGHAGWRYVNAAGSGACSGDPGR